MAGCTIGHHTTFGIVMDRVLPTFICIFMHMAWHTVFVGRGLPIDPVQSDSYADSHSHTKQGKQDNSAFTRTRRRDGRWGHNSLMAAEARHKRDSYNLRNAISEHIPLNVSRTALFRSVFASAIYYWATPTRIGYICIKSFYFDVSAIRQTKVHKISKISPKNATISPVEISSPSPTHPNTFPQRKSLRHSFPKLGNTAHQLRSTPRHIRNQNNRKRSQLGQPILIT